MSTTTHSGLRDTASPRPPSDPRPDSNSTTPEPPVHDNLLDSFMYGLKSIFESLVTRPDFSRYYERDPHRRQLASWARVGHSMQHALGKPVTFSVMSPDGRRMTHVVAPDTSDEPYHAALRRAREAAPDLDAGTSSDHVVIHLTGKQAADLMAQAGGRCGMTPDDSDDKSPSSDGIARKEEDTATPADGAAGETPVVHIEETTTVVRWEAPLPPPALLEEYDRIVPGLAREIAEQARVSESHIHEIKRTALTAAIESVTRGQWMGFIALLAILGVSAFAIAKGAWWVAGIALSVVTGTAAVFVLGTLKKRDGKRQGE